MKVYVYQSKPMPHQAPGGYWFVRIRNETSGLTVDVPITHAKAQDLMAMGAPQLSQGGGL